MINVFLLGESSVFSLKNFRIWQQLKRTLTCSHIHSLLSASISVTRHLKCAPDSNRESHSNERILQSWAKLKYWKFWESRTHTIYADWKSKINRNRFYLSYPVSMKDIIIFYCSETSPFAIIPNFQTQNVKILKRWKRY